jgi:hypothetical protein
MVAFRVSNVVLMGFDFLGQALGLRLWGKFMVAWCRIG